MVLAYFPQKSKLSLSTNSNNPPQGLLFAAAVPPVETFRIIATYPSIADSSFQFNRFYQIKKGQVAGIQTDMPLVIIDSLPAGTFQDLTNGFDVRVFDSSNNAIPYESIDILVNGDGSADIEIWLKMPLVADFEIIQLAFGKSGATDDSNPNGVYDADYMGAYHLNQTVFGVDSIIDSTVNANDGDTTLPLSSITGPVGNAISFGSEGNIDNGGSLMSAMNQVGTVSMWVNIADLTDGTSTSRIFYSLVNGVTAKWEVLINTAPATNQIIFRYGNATAEITVDLPTSIFNSGEDHLFTFTWDRSIDESRIYIDGNIFVTQNVAWPLSITGGNITSLANEEVPTALTSLLGSLDEARFSDIVRDSDWILTEFNNQNDNDAFWFRTPRLAVADTNFLVDDLGNNIVTEIP